MIHLHMWQKQLNEEEAFCFIKFAHLFARLF